MWKQLSNVSAKILSSQISSYQQSFKWSALIPTIMVLRCCHLQNSSKLILLSSAKRLHISKGKSKYHATNLMKVNDRSISVVHHWSCTSWNEPQQASFAYMWINKRGSSRQTLEDFFFNLTQNWILTLNNMIRKNRLLWATSHTVVISDSLAKTL